ncbi:MAG: transglycosylase family protein [Actinobacteria bacterium]|nr:transglycosylase family protein [Actinomycetota bacterium]
MRGPAVDLLDRLADCESGRNPRAVGGRGRFFGAFQFLPSTWRSLGMAGNPVDYDYATQKAVAARIPVSAWSRQFPACSRRLGVGGGGGVGAW